MVESVLALVGLSEQQMIIQGTVIIKLLETSSLTPPKTSGQISPSGWSFPEYQFGSATA